MTIYRRKFTHQEKISIISRHFKEGISISELARVNDIHPVTLYSWKRHMSKKPKEDDLLNIKKILEENAELKKQNKSLKKIVGEQVLDIDCMKDLIEFLKKKELGAQLKKQKSSSKKTIATPKGE